MISELAKETGRAPRARPERNGVQSHVKRDLDSTDIMRGHATLKLCRTEPNPS